jgi:hypothetical protein
MRFFKPPPLFFLYVRAHLPGYLHAVVSSSLDVSPPPRAPPSSSSARSVLLAAGARAQPSGSPARLLSFPSTRSFPKLLWRLASIPLRAYLPQLPSASCSAPWFQLALAAELSIALSFSLSWLRVKFLWPRPPFLFQLTQVCCSSSIVVAGCSGSMVVGLWVQAVLGSLPCTSLPLPSACRAWIQPQRHGILPRREFPCLPWPALGLLLAADARRLAGLLPPPCACSPLSARVPSSAARSSYGARLCFFPSVPLLPAEALVFSLARSELPRGRAWFSVSSTKSDRSSTCSVPAPASAPVHRPTIAAPPAP